MKIRSLLGVMVLGGMVAVATPSYAQFLDKATAEKLFNGNTLAGHDFKYDREVKIYFAPAGTYNRLDDLNNKEAGVWKIESDGQLCMKHAQNWNCRNIKPLEKAGRYMLIKDGKKSLKVEAVLPGNPNNL